VSAFLPIRELARIAFPRGTERGGVFVLHRIGAYFDDAGTHADSEFVVVGGLLGTLEQWEAFEHQWAAKLRAPLPGKPPLRMFHLSHCNAGEGEFATYTPAEQDAVTHDFRRIIIDAKLTSTSSAVDRRAWDELVVGPYRALLGSALGACAGNCVSETVRIAGAHAIDTIATVFDLGIHSDDVNKATEPYTYPLGRPRVISINYLRVADSLPLQGADIVATESYWHLIKTRRQGHGAQPRAHFRHYLENMLSEGLILDRDAIETELRRGPDGRVLESQPA
jgi:hypothetical protein